MAALQKHVKFDMHDILKCAYIVSFICMVMSIMFAMTDVESYRLTPRTAFKKTVEVTLGYYKDMFKDSQARGNVPHPWRKPLTFSIIFVPILIILINYFKNLIIFLNDGTYRPIIKAYDLLPRK